MDELFQDEDAADLVSPEDQDEFRKEQASAKDSLNAAKGCKDELAKARKTSAATKAGRVALKAAKWVSSFPPGDIGLPAARLLLPPELTGFKARLYSHEDLGRWWAEILPAGYVRSRAWNLYGYNASLTLMISWCWEHFLEFHGLPHSSCPIKGLLA